MALDPTDSEVIRDALTSRLLDVWTATIGRVETYYPETQTADILPVVRRPLQAADGFVGHEDVPVLPNVPVLQPRAGGYFVHLPIIAGDTVLVVFTSDSFQMWRGSGSVVNPGDLRRHSLANAIAIPGVFPAAMALADIPTDMAVLGGGVYRVGAASAGFVALAAKVDAALDAIQSWATSHAHSIPTGTSGPASPALSAAASVAATKLKSE
jgi:hypothetical protein